MRGLKELRVKESDRVEATAALLAVNGARVEVEGDDLIVHGDGRPLKGGGLVRTDMDHRIAMAFSVAANVISSTSPMNSRGEATMSTLRYVRIRR